MINLNTNYLATDFDFGDFRLNRVIENEDGCWLELDEGIAIFAKEPPIQPEEGARVRVYGRVFPGNRPRGLFVDGTCLFYRTPSEQQAFLQSRAEDFLRERAH